MTTDGFDSLDDLATNVDDEFASHRGSDDSKTVSLVIDTTSSERPTLIVHVDKKGELLADKIEAFLIEYDTYTQRKYHSEIDVRIRIPTPIRPYRHTNQSTPY